MGYGTRDGGIRTFWPDDTDTEFYIMSSATLEDIIEQAKAKWPQADFSNITIEAEHVHTDCLGHDQYDGGDYTDFLCITRSSS